LCPKSSTSDSRVPAQKSCIAASLIVVLSSVLWLLSRQLASDDGVLFLMSGLAGLSLFCGLTSSLVFLLLSTLAIAYVQHPSLWPLLPAQRLPLTLYLLAGATLLCVMEWHKWRISRHTRILRAEATYRQLLGQQLEQSLERITELEAEYRQTFEEAPVGVAHVSLSGRWLRVNRYLCQMLGYSWGEMLSKTFSDISHVDDLPADQQLQQDLLSGLCVKGCLEKRYRHADGHIIWIQLTVTLVRTPIGQPLHFVCIIEDISAYKQTDEQLHLTSQVFDRTGEAIFISDENGVILTANPAFSRITGYTLGEAVGQQPSLLSSHYHSRAFYQQIWNDLKTLGCWQGQIWNKRKNGEIYLEWLTIDSVRNAEGQPRNFIAAFSDITALKNSQHRLEYLAHHDDLTSLANRTVFQDRLQQAVALVRREHQLLAVLLIDLDNFKTINDTLGHETGDLLLKEVAQRLLTCIRDADTIARLGGDEFAALLYNIEPEEVSTVAQRIIDSLSQPIGLNRTELFITASIGITLFPNDGEDSGSLLKNADSAMYRAKEQGKNKFQYFSNEIKVVIQRRHTLENALRRALQAHGLRLHYQPKIELASNRLIGAEALLRWTDPELGPISPAEFIPVAEQAGLIGHIGQFVVKQAIADILAWGDAGLAAPPIALNISPSQLRNDSFALWLHERLAASSLSTSAIVVELTEGALMEQGDAGIQVLDSLASRGIKISIDDFGTGYSSLSYLKRMPISELKIDRSFVINLAEDPDSRAIASAILGLAHALGMRVVAEGVETAEQLAVLRQLDCDIAQGYFFHRPLEEASFRLLLQPDDLPWTDPDRVAPHPDALLPINH
jgi:two-component system CheB/CheR fusion protein